jgi:hypothetical protein
MKHSNKTNNSSRHSNSEGLIKRLFGRYALYLYPEITVVSSTVAPTNIVILSIVSLISTVASLSSEAPHKSTRNTEWPIALKYNIHDGSMLSHTL